jgi:SAM-dependent methyltransferase
MSIHNHNERRTSFDQVAALYNQTRPGYPNALFEDVIAFSNLRPNGQILEIGCGTGQATLPFARQGYSVCCIEPGASLAALAQQNLASYPSAKVLISPFETWVEAEASFDLVISATAFHWIDPAVRYSKAAQILKSNGAIALFWNKHVQTENSADFFQAVQAVYERIVPDMAQKFSGLLHPNAIPTPIKEELDHSNLFGTVVIHKYKWDRVYDAADYINLLNTYSDHRTLDNSIREALFLDIAELINVQFGGQLIKEYLTVLYLAHRK